MSELRESSIADLLSAPSQESIELLREEFRLVSADVLSHRHDYGNERTRL